MSTEQRYKINVDRIALDNLMGNEIMLKSQTSESAHFGIMSNLSTHLF